MSNYTNLNVYYAKLHLFVNTLLTIVKNVNIHFSIVVADNKLRKCTKVLEINNPLT